MSQQCSWPTLSWPLEGRCLYYALLGLTQAPGFAGGHDFYCYRENILYFILHHTVLRVSANGCIYPLHFSQIWQTEFLLFPDSDEPVHYNELRP